MNKENRENRENKENTFYEICVYHLPLFFFCGLIFYISSIPNITPPSIFGIWDKLNHFGAYFVMMFLMFWSFRKIFSKRDLRKIILFAFIATSFYGISDELHQYFVPNRSSDFFDWLADATGAGLAGLIILKSEKFIKTI